MNRNGNGGEFSGKEFDTLRHAGARRVPRLGSRKTAIPLHHRCMGASPDLRRQARISDRRTASERPDPTSALTSMVGEKRQKNDHWDRHAEQPQKN